jgi:hypothetical protein
MGFLVCCRMQPRTEVLSVRGLNPATERGPGVAGSQRANKVDDEGQE